MLTFEHKDYHIIEQKKVFQGYFAVNELSLKHRLFNGNWSNVHRREIFERGSAAAVLLYDPLLTKVVLIEQFRPGALGSRRSPWLIEIVAGIIEPDETAYDVAIREAEEEAGQVISDLLKISEYFATPGGSTEKLTVYCARVDANDAEGIYGLEHENEDIRVFTMSVDEVRQGFDEGVFENATVIIALQWLLLNQQKIHKTWDV